MIHKTFICKNIHYLNLRQRLTIIKNVDLIESVCHYVLLPFLQFDFWTKAFILFSIQLISNQQSQLLQGVEIKVFYLFEICYQVINIGRQLINHQLCILVDTQEPYCSYIFQLMHIFKIVFFKRKRLNPCTIFNTIQILNFVTTEIKLL